MPEILTKDYLDAQLGTIVSVNGENFVIAYEHNVGRSALYSPDGKHLARFLKKDDVVVFEQGKIEKIVLDIIRE